MKFPIGKKLKNKTRIFLPRNNSRRTGNCRMSLFKNYGLAFVMTVNITVASLFAKNMISYPLGYNFSCSYGVPLAVWETYSENNMERFRFISRAYHVSAINIGYQSIILNFVIDTIIFLSIFFLLQKLSKEDRVKILLRKYAFFLTLFLLLLLWTNIFTGWESGIYRFLYLAVVVLEILLVLLAILKGFMACFTRNAETRCGK